MICPYCKSTLPPAPERFCTSCGGDLQAAPALPSAPPASPPPPVPVVPAASSHGGGRQAGAGAPAPAGGGARYDGPPWEERERIGFGAAFVDTTKGVLAEPADFFRRMRPMGGIGAPLFYGVLTGYLGLLVTSVYQFVWHVVAGGPVEPAGDTPAEQLLAALQGGMTIGQLAFNVLLGPVLVAEGLFIDAGIYHLALLVLGGAQRDFEATLRVTCYGGATQLFQIVPGCGGLIAVVWNIVVQIIGLAEVHGISRGKAAGAVLLPLLLLCCCCVGLAALLGFGIAGLAGMAR